MNARYEQMVKALLRKRGVSRKVGERFGSGALTVNGRIFAMMSARGDFVVKLPRDRVAALLVAGAGSPFDSGRGRVMKEWVAINPRSRLDWSELADEARQFVLFALTDDPLRQRRGTRRPRERGPVIAIALSSSSR